MQNEEGLGAGVGGSPEAHVGAASGEVQRHLSAEPGAPNQGVPQE